MTESLYTYLSAQSAITDLVGTHIYPHWIPQDQSTWPLITITKIGESHTHHLGGAGTFATARYQIDCWGLTLASVDAVHEAVRQSLQGMSGTMGTDTVHFVVCDSVRELHEQPKDASDQRKYRISSDYLIKYTAN